MTERAMVLNQPVDQFDPFALIAPVSDIEPRTSAMCHKPTLENSVSTWMAPGPLSPPAEKVHS